MSKQSLEEEQKRRDEAEERADLAEDRLLRLIEKVKEDRARRNEELSKGTVRIS